MTFNFKLQNSMSRCWLFLLFCMFSQATFAQNVGIGQTDFTPDASAVLELQATNKGFLVPRMTTAQRDAITNPANGLLIYNTTDANFWYYDANAKLWKPLFSLVKRGGIYELDGGIGIAGVLRVDGANATFKAITATGNVTAPTFIGNLTGNVTGNVTGDVTGNLTGNVTGNVTGDLTGNVTGGTIAGSSLNISGAATVQSLNAGAGAIQTTGPITGGAITGSSLRITGAAADQILLSDASGVFRAVNKSSLGGDDNLGNHIATRTLNLGSNSLVNVATVTFSSVTRGNASLYLGLDGSNNVVATDTLSLDNLNVKGNTTLATTTINGPATVNNNLSVSGSSQLATTTVKGVLTVTDETKLATLTLKPIKLGDVSNLIGVNSEGTVTATNTIVVDNLNVKGTTRLATTTISGPATVNNNLNVSDSSQLATTTVSGPLTAINSSTLATITLSPTPSIENAALFLAINAQGTIISTNTVAGEDNLGNHIATQELNLGSNSIIFAGTTTFAQNASPTFVNTFDRYLVMSAEGTIVATTTVADNLGNHQATQTLEMGTHLIAFSDGNKGIRLFKEGTTVVQDIVHIEGTGTNIIEGNLDIRGTARGIVFSNVSDKRVKTDIQNMPTTLAKVLQLRPVTYFFTPEYTKSSKFTDTKRYGFIAQEVAKLFPELITIEQKQVGNELIKDFHSLNYIELTSIIIKSVQELDKKVGKNESEIEQLKRENQELKSQVSTLQTQLNTLLQLKNQVEQLTKMMENKQGSKKAAAEEE